MKVGLCIVISQSLTMQHITYVLETFELAAAQAVELQKGVKGRIEKVATEPTPENGMRQIVWTFPDYDELIVVQEAEVGTKVLEVK